MPKWAFLFLNDYTEKSKTGWYVGGSLFAGHTFNYFWRACKHYVWCNQIVRLFQYPKRVEIIFVTATDFYSLVCIKRVFYLYHCLR